MFLFENTGNFIGEATLKVFYSDHYAIELPPNHRFPIEKYRLLREGLLEQEILAPGQLFQSPLASREVITLAHTSDYFDSIYSGNIDPRLMRQIGLPWSRELVRRSLASVGGAICAAEEALSKGFSGNLAGGTHHALAGEGQGFCVFNDLAVAALHLFQQGRIRKAAIIDLDVHQGNGTAAILGSHQDVFLFSMHGEKNYPFRKVPSTLDVGLPDNAGDTQYLFALQRALPAVIAFDPDIILYQAGVDPLQQDRLGRLSLSMAGLAERDYLVLSTCKQNDIPIALAMGGGYARPIQLTVDAHLQTYRIAAEIFSQEGK
jgi:acetoin utilization deacetylase AcuC-like enzyme